MPELPEVETIVRDLNKKIVGKKITHIWADWPGHFKHSPGGINAFKKEIVDKQIRGVQRLGKNIIFDLGAWMMLVHLKMTGKLLVETRNKGQETRKAEAAEKSKHVHMVFWLSGGTIMSFSDVRKFGKMALIPKKDFQTSEHMSRLGPDMLDAELNAEIFKNLIKKRHGPIKKTLMDQNVISGIGNIYSDEILFTAKIHPLKRASTLTEKDLKAIFDASRKILKKAVKLRGSSISDYRDTEGKPGSYAQVRLVYRRKGEPCPRCGTKISRLMVGGRSAHFCPKCQI